MDASPHPPISLPTISDTGSVEILKRVLREKPTMTSSEGVGPGTHAAVTSRHWKKRSSLTLQPPPPKAREGVDAAELDRRQRQVRVGGVGTGSWCSAREEEEFFAR